MPRSRSSAPKALLTVLLILFLILPLLGPAHGADTINYNGVGPTTISLYWSQSGYLLFNRYELQQSISGSNGPWTTILTTTDKSRTSTYVYDLSPSSTYWWRIIDYDCCGATAITNTLQVTQPAVATLGYTLLTSTSVQFSWTNNAVYSGYVSFASYELMESVNGGLYSVTATISSVSTTTYTINGLSPATSYSFYIVTTDQCIGCSGGNAPSASSSNVISIVPPSPLSASARTSPASVDVGQLVSFSCAAAGGVSPYTYSWTFGDGDSGTGQSPGHIYNSPGIMDAVCTVADRLMSTVNSPVIVTVSSDPAITVPVAQPNIADVGQSVTFTTSAVGGSGGFAYAWTGLPAGCGSANTNSLFCSLSTPGTFYVTVSVTDSNGFTATSNVLAFLVNPDPVVTGFAANSTNLDLGRSVSLVVSASGGTGQLSYSYSGLPPGCSSSNVSSLSCTPTTSGNFRVTVTVTDAAGKAVTSSINITVTQTVLGLPLVAGYFLIGGISAAIAASALVGLMQVRRRRRGRSLDGSKNVTANQTKEDQNAGAHSN